MNRADGAGGAQFIDHIYILSRRQRDRERKPPPPVVESVLLAAGRVPLFLRTTYSTPPPPLPSSDERASTYSTQGLTQAQRKRRKIERDIVEFNRT